MSDHNPLTLRLNPREKIAYGMGDAGSNLVFCIGTLYLLKFYIDKLRMPAYYSGIIFLAARFFTAFTDILTEFLLDSRKNIGPRDKFRPFILYAAVPATLIATFQLTATTFCLPVKTTTATALFMMFGLSYSLMDYSYGAMIPTITKNSNEHTQLAAYRQGGATTGLLICTMAPIPLQSSFSDSTVGYACAALVFSVGGFIFTILCYRDVKEHYVDIMPTGHKASILKSLCAIFRNPPPLALCIANLCTLTAFSIKLAIQVYYTQYMLNDTNLLSWVGFFSMGYILVGVLLVPATVKCFGKKQVYLTGMVLQAVGNILNCFQGSNSFTFVMFSCVTFSDTAFVNSLNWALAPDTVDYGEWKTGIRAEGSVHTDYISFCRISATLTDFLSGIMLTRIGYVPNIAQSDAALQGLRQFIFIWSYALAVIAALAMGSFYTLSEKRFTLVIEEINQRKNKGVTTEEKTASVMLQTSIAAISILVGGGLPTFKKWTYYEKD